MKRLPAYSYYEIDAIGHLKSDLRGNKKMKSLVGKDMLVSNKHKVVLCFIQNAELEELEGLEVGLFVQEVYATNTVPKK